MNQFQFAFAVEAAFEEQLKQGANFPGYQRKYTWCSDLMLAAPYGEAAVKDTVESCKKFWSNNKEAVGEMAAALNFICWMYYGRGDNAMSKVFADAYYEFTGWMYDNCSEDLSAWVHRFLD